MCYESKLIDLEKATDGDVYDSNWQGGKWMMRRQEVSKTMDEILKDSGQWEERNTREPEMGVIGGLPVMVWEKVQTVKGETRSSLSVMDFGDRRVIVRHDLTEFFA